MALKLMPGETRNYTFKLPDPISSIDSIDVRFFQDGGKIVEYDETQTNNVYQVAGEENLLVCTLPRADTLLFENKIPASVQIEWSIGIYHSIAKEQRITVGNYLNKDYLESGGTV